MTIRTTLSKRNKSGLCKLGNIWKWVCCFGQTKTNCSCQTGKLYNSGIKYLEATKAQSTSPCCTALNKYRVGWVCSSIGKFGYCCIHWLSNWGRRIAAVVSILPKRMVSFGSISPSWKIFSLYYVEQSFEQHNYAAVVRHSLRSLGYYDWIK